MSCRPHQISYLENHFFTMKFIPIFTFIFLAFHFTYGQTAKETQNIVEQILTITEKYNKTWETLNMDDVAKYHSDSSFRYYRDMKLSVGCNEKFKKVTPQLFKGTKSCTMEVSNPVVQILSKNAAVISFTGVAKLVTKKNEVLDIGTGAYTYIWQKINNKWKIVHIHESAK